MEASMTEIIEMLVRALVDEPDQVRVMESQGEKTQVFEVSVAKKDMGKVIGRNGRTIESLRTIVGACGAKRKQRCIFQIIDEEDDSDSYRGT